MVVIDEVFWLTYSRCICLVSASLSILYIIL